MIHHISIRTANIHQAIAFYEGLGFTVKERFTTGYTLACWLEGLGGRIELIQIPEPQSAPDAFNNEHYVGYYHISFDLTQLTPSLPQWLSEFKTKLSTIPLLENYSLTILLNPTQQMIENKIYEVAFISDCDGLPLELIRLIKA